MKTILLTGIFGCLSPQMLTNGGCLCCVFGAPMFQCVCDYLYQIIICGAFYPNYFFKRQFDEVEAVKSLSNHDPMNTVMVSLA